LQKKKSAQKFEIIALNNVFIFDLYNTVGVAVDIPFATDNLDNSCLCFSLNERCQFLISTIIGRYGRHFVCLPFRVRLKSR